MSSWNNIKNGFQIKDMVDSFLGKKAYSLLIDTTNGCNLKCVFCTRNNDKVIKMKTDDFDCILRKIHQHINSLQLSCAWEYSIAKNAADIIRSIGKYNIASTTIYTNGNILTDGIAEALIDICLNDFVVSMGEARKKTYETIHRGGEFEKVISNIKILDGLKKKRNSKYPRICTNLTLVNSNIGELIDFIDLAYDIGVTKIIGRHLILNEGLDMKNEIVQNTKHANEIIDIAEAKAVEYGMTFSIPRYESLTSKSCRAPWRQLYISSNGDVSVCPRIHMYEKIGNLLEDSFFEVIKSKRMKQLKDQFNHLDFNNPVCKICMYNREIDQAINQGF